MKYILEIKPEYEANGIMILGARDSHLYVTTLEVKDLEELNSEYINEHFGDLQDTAYDKGYAQCQDDYGDALKHAKDTAYQRGLEDGKKATWEAVRKVIHLPEGVVLDLFTDCYSSVCTVLQVFLKYEGSEVIEKLKAYEDDKIKRGDIVNVKGSCKDDLLGVVTKVWEDNCYIMWGDGSGGAWSKDSVVKTGKHIDVDKFFEEIAT